MATVAAATAMKVGTEILETSVCSPCPELVQKLYLQQNQFYHTLRSMLARDLSVWKFQRYCN